MTRPGVRWPIRWSTPVESGLSDSEDVAPGLGLVLVHVDSHLRGAQPELALVRQVPAERRGESILMPEGKVLTVLLDEKSANYQGLMEPAHVFRGAQTYLVNRPVGGGATDLWLVLERPTPWVQFDADNTTVALRIPGGERSADLVISDRERISSIWFSVPGTAADVVLASETGYLPETALALRPSGLTTHLTSLRPLPSVTVVLDLPAAMRMDGASLVVRQASSEAATGTDAVVRRLPVAVEKTRYRLDHLPAAPVLVSLDRPPWFWSVAVDLESGRDATLEMAPRPRRVRGRVLRGEQPVAARVEITTDAARGYSLVIHTEPSGTFATAVWRDGRFRVRAHPLDGGGAIDTEITIDAVPNGPEQAAPETRVDLHIPAYDVTLILPKSREPMPAGSEIVATHRDRHGHEQTWAGYADAAGRLALGWMHGGTLTVTAPQRMIPLKLEGAPGVRKLRLRPAERSEQQRMPPTYGGRGVGSGRGQRFPRGRTSIRPGS